MDLSMKINIQHLFKIVLPKTQQNIKYNLTRNALLLIINIDLNSAAIANGCSPKLYHWASVKHCDLPALSPSYLLPHGYSSWGNDDVSTADAFIQSAEKVIRAVEEEARVGNSKV